MNELLDPIQLLSLAVSLDTLRVIYMQYRLDKPNWRWHIPMLLFVLNTAFFYVAVLVENAGLFNFHQIHPNFFTMWSAGRSLFGQAVIRMVEGMRLRLKKNKGV